MKIEGTKRPINSKCRVCDIEFTVEVICYDKGFLTGMPREYVRKECVDCMRYESRMYNQKKVYGYIKQMEDWMETLPHDSDRNQVSHYLRMIKKIAKRKCDENVELIKLYKTGNFMMEELSTLLGKPLLEVKKILMEKE